MKGSLIRDASREQLIHEIERLDALVANCSGSSPRVREGRLAPSPRFKPINVEGLRIASREREALAYTILGYTSVETARMMGVSPYTVRNQLQNLYFKFGVRNKAELIAFGIRVGIMEGAKDVMGGALQVRPSRRKE